MTKEELLRQAAKSLPSKVTTVKEEKAFIEGYVTGAEGMQERLIEKVAEWMRNFKDGEGKFSLYDYVGNLKQAMEK